MNVWCFVEYVTNIFCRRVQFILVTTYARALPFLMSCSVGTCRWDSSFVLKVLHKMFCLIDCVRLLGILSHYVTLTYSRALAISWLEKCMCLIKLLSLSAN